MFRSALAPLGKFRSEKNQLAFLADVIVAFLARDSIYAIARSLPSPVRLSVCLAVCLSFTRVDQSKTV